jgi:hypothetical protein
MATTDILAIVQSAPDVASGDASWVASLVAQAQAAIAAFCNLPAFGADEPPGTPREPLLEAICAQIALEAYRATSLAPETYDDPSVRVARAAESFAVTLGRYKGLLTRFRRLTV